MNTLSITLLGLPRFARNGAPVALTRAKGIALLLYLAVTRAAQPRERVLDLLWPESLPQAARKNMRNTLWAIGEAFGEDLFEQDGTSIRLADKVQVDVHALEDGLLLLSSSSVVALEAAAAHYHGPLGDGLMLHEAPDFELWLTTERERLATVYFTLLERIVALRRDAGDWQAILAHAARALAADPLRESMHLALIEAQVRLGQRAQAAQQYAALTEILQRELDIEPLPETTARYEALLTSTQLLPVPQLSEPTRSPEPPLPFVGREAELAILDAELARADKGAARVVLISGDLGMGKTQLWRTWIDTRKIKAVVLATHALETDEPVPFGPLLTLFRQPGPAQTLIESPSHFAPIWLAELARLLPEIAATWPGLPPPLVLSHAEERARLLQALTEAMRLLAQPLLVLVIDDLHWADPSTLDWLVYLIDHLRDTPLLVIGTYRSQDAPERLTAIAAGWQRQGRLRQIALPHLTDDESQTLLNILGAPDDPQLAQTLVHQSGGNPYFLIELQRTPLDESFCDLATLVHARVQATVPASAMQMLQAAAVLGDGMEIMTLQATSGRNEEETLDALDALQAGAVLDIQAGIYRFIHPLVATIVRGNLSPMRRAFLHRRAAEALERTTSKPERVAGQLMEHFAAAGELSRAAHYAEQAAAQALAVGAFVEATTYARHALQWELTPRRQLLLGESLMMFGSSHEGQVQLEAAIHGFEQAKDVIGTTEVAITLARMAIGMSKPELARAWLTHVPLERVAIDNPALSGQAHFIAAGAERQSQAYDAAAVQLAYAERIAQDHHLTMLASQVAFERGNLHAERGNLKDALAAFEEAVRLAQISANTVFEAMARNNLAYHTLLTGDLDAAQAHIQIAAELTQRYAFNFLQQYVQSTTGEIALAQGKLDIADAALARAYEAANAWGNRLHMANVRANQAQVAQARNDSRAARALIAEAQTLFGDSVDPFVRDKIARVGAAVT